MGCEKRLVRAQSDTRVGDQVMWGPWGPDLSSRPREAPVDLLVCALLSRELKAGIPVTDEQGARLGESAHAAKQAITQVVVSRILMAAPGMG